MKITRRQLRQIIKEEFSILDEQIIMDQPSYDDAGGGARVAGLGGSTRQYNWSPLSTFEKRVCDHDRGGLDPDDCEVIELEGFIENIRDFGSGPTSLLRSYNWRVGIVGEAREWLAGGNLGEAEIYLDDPSAVWVDGFGVSLARMRPYGVVRIGHVIASEGDTLESLTSDHSPDWAAVDDNIVLNNRLDEDGLISSGDIVALFIRPDSTATPGL